MISQSNYNSIHDFLANRIKNYAEVFSKNKNSAISSFVTISRQTGAGGHSVGIEIQQLLNQNEITYGHWQVFDKNLVGEVIREHHFPDNFKKYLSEDVMAQLSGWLGKTQRPHLSTDVLVQKIDQTIWHLSKMGNAIIVGRGANLVAKEAGCGVHVRIISSYKDRLEHTMKYYQLLKKDAEKMIKEQDELRANYIKTYFDADIEDPENYDLIINTTKNTYKDTAKIILEALKLKRQRNGMRV